MIGVPCFTILNIVILGTVRFQTAVTLVPFTVLCGGLCKYL